MKKIAILVGLAMVLTSIMVIAPPRAEAGSIAQVAIYNGRGAWAEGLTAFENFLTYKGITWSTVNERYLNKNSLIGKFDAIYFPGGSTTEMNSAITSVGKTNIRNFITAGGGYIGICAGAYFATTGMYWYGDWYEFDLDLFNGYSVGPLPIIPGGGGTYDMITIDMDLTNPINQYESGIETVLYYDGNAMYPYSGQTYSTIATYPTYNNDLAALNFNYGSGRVFVIGPHPEIEEDSTRDGTTFADEYNDAGTEWDLLWTAMDWVLGNPISSPPIGDLPDSQAPVINWISDTPDPVAQGNPVTITASVTDNIAVEHVWVNVNGQDHDMTLNGGNYVYILPTGGSSGEFFFDGFESGGLAGWSVYGTGQPWKVVTDTPYQGIYCAQAKYTGGDKWTYLEKSIDTTGKSSITFSYQRRIFGYDSVETWQVQWFDGTNWNTVEYVTTCNDANYVYKEFALPSGANNNPNFKIRFGTECNAFSEKANLDNVRLTAAGEPLPTGLYPYTVYAHDPAGNEATPMSGDFTII